MKITRCINAKEQYILVYEHYYPDGSYKTEKKLVTRKPGESDYDMKKRVLDQLYKSHFNKMDGHSFEDPSSARLQYTSRVKNSKLPAGMGVLENYLNLVVKAASKLPTELLQCPYGPAFVNFVGRQDIQPILNDKDRNDLMQMVNKVLSDRSHLKLSDFDQDCFEMLTMIINDEFDKPVTKDELIKYSKELISNPKAWYPDAPSSGQVMKFKAAAEKLLGISLGSAPTKPVNFSEVEELIECINEAQQYGNPNENIGFTVGDTFCCVRKGKLYVLPDEDDGSYRMDTAPSSEYMVGNYTEDPYALQDLLRKYTAGGEIGF